MSGGVPAVGRMVAFVFCLPVDEDRIGDLLNGLRRRAPGPSLVLPGFGARSVIAAISARLPWIGYRPGLGPAARSCRASLPPRLLWRGLERACGRERARGRGPRPLAGRS
jgi:hypothetical protein